MKRLIILTVAIAAFAAAQPALVTVGGKVYNSDGTGFTGKLTILNASLVCTDVPVPTSSRDYSALAGVVSPAVQLFPLADCTPGYSYTVIYQGKERSTVFWDIHASPTTTTIGIVQRQGPIPPSMQVRWSQIMNAPLFQTTLTWLGAGIAGALDQILGTAAQKPTSYFQPSIAGAPVTWPAFSAIATSGSYLDLANKPLLTPAAIGAVREAIWGAPGFDQGSFYYQQISRLAAVRAAEPALRYGRFYFRPISGDGQHFGVSTFPQGILAFSRILVDQEIIIAANFSPTETRSFDVIVDITLNHPADQYRVRFSNKPTFQGPDRVIEKASGAVSVQETNGTSGSGPLRSIRVSLAPLEVQILGR